MKYARAITLFNRKEVALFFKNARRIAVNDAFTILAAPRVHTFARILIITPRAIGTSVARHRLRRRLKHIFYQEQLLNRLIYDIAVITRSAALTYDYISIKNFILKTAEQCNAS